MAEEIQNNWTNVSFGARPYLDAMFCLNGINDQYGDDSAESIVRYFLANAQTWRGETAKVVKQQLNQLLKTAK